MLRLKYEKQSLQTYIEKQVIHTFDQNIMALNFKLILLVLLLS